MISVYLLLDFIFCFLRFLYNRLFPIVFYILAFPNYIGFSQLYFIYWLFPIILCFSPIVFIQLL